MTIKTDNELKFNNSDFYICENGKPRINMLNNWLKSIFGCKVIKLAIDGGFTCPNRDGTKGIDGCAFCSASGSGDMASKSGKILEDLDEQINLLKDKWPNSKCIAYFQSHSNTYGSIEELRKKYYEALSHNKVDGIAIATRPDCINEEITNLLSEINKKTFMWVELGLQTIHQKTMNDMNLCYTIADYNNAINLLKSKNINVVTHLILGLPNENRKMMIESVKYVCKDNISGLKLHMFNLVKGSTMEKTYPNYISFKSIDEYVNLVVDLLEIIPYNIVIHRMSGDAVRKTLIEPKWSYKKRTILNNIHKLMKEKNTWQGRLYE